MCEDIQSTFATNLKPVTKHSQPIPCSRATLDKPQTCERENKHLWLQDGKLLSGLLCSIIVGIDDLYSYIGFGGIDTKRRDKIKDKLWKGAQERVSLFKSWERNGSH